MFPASRISASFSFGDPEVMTRDISYQSPTGISTTVFEERRREQEEHDARNDAYETWRDEPGDYDRFEYEGQPDDAMTADMFEEHDIRYTPTARVQDIVTATRR
jgi:hypothetical protein